MKIELLSHLRPKHVIKFSLLAFVMLFAAGVSAQVKGTVKDSGTGEPLIGASVSIKGTTTGTVTGLEGDFVLDAKAGDLLQIVYTGFTTQEVTVGADLNVNVLLEAGALLDEVLVTGYSTQRKKDLSGAVSIVKSKDLIAIPTGNFIGALEGRAAGVSIGTSGEPGSSVSVRIRGVSTFGDNNPLYIIDGVPRRGAYQNAINPNDIESIQVLKDASAASIYGSRAGNGVIIITTKKGKAGQPKVTYDASYGLQNPVKLVKMLNSQEWATMRFKALANAGAKPEGANAQLYGTGSTPVLPDYILPAGAKEGDPRVDPSKYNADINSSGFNLITKANKVGTNWQQEVFNQAPITQHNLSILGGSEKSRYGVSFNYFDQDGILITSFSKRYSFRANTEFKMKKYLTVGQNLTVALESSNRPLGGGQNEGSPIMNAIRAQPIMPLYDIKGFYAGGKGIATNAGSPFAQLDRGRDNSNKFNTIFGNVYGELNLGFLDDALGTGFLNGLTYRSSIGGNYGSGHFYNFNYRNIEHAEPSSSNGFNEGVNDNNDYTFTNTLIWDKTIGSHTIKLLAGTEAILSQYRNVGGSRSNYFTDDKNFWTLRGGAPTGQNNYSDAGNSSLFSLFARADATLFDKYIVSGTVRRDGSSRFGSESRYGVFPAFSVAWRMSQEDFMQGIDWLDDLKVRFGWGQTGNQEIDANNPYSQYSSGIVFSSYDINGNSTNPVAGFAQASVGNLKSKWEATTTSNFGVDASIMNGKMDITLDIWNRKTTDLLYRLPLPSTAGTITAPFVNIGDMENKGIDLGINYRGGITKALKYDLGLIFGTYKNQILRVGDSDESFFSGGGSRFAGTGITRSIKGLPISTFYGYKVIGIFKNQAEVDAAPDQSSVVGAKIGRWKFADLNNDKKIDGKDYGNIGNPHPDFTFGFNLGLTYKRFDFTAFLQGTVGNEIYNYTRYWIDFETFNGGRSYESLYESWDPQTNPNSLLPRLDFSDQQSNQASTSYYVEDGSYVRLKNLQLGYQLPSIGSKIGLDNLRLYIQGLNVFTMTKYRGYDPAFNVADPGAAGSDGTIGIDYGFYPAARTIMFGLSASF